jgi:hypothetical protein
MKSLNRSTTHPIIMFNPDGDDVQNEDNKYVFVGKVYGTPSINKDLEKVQQVLSKFPRISADEVVKGKDGVYTWLLYSVSGSDEIQFVATEVVSPYEIGTRHQSIAYNVRINASKLYGGGELLKAKDSIRFNLLSGTYSRPLVQYNFSNKVSSEIIKAFLTFIPDAVYDDSGDTYIRKVKHVSNELLDIYKDIGYTVRLFDSQSDCAKFSNEFWHIDFNLEYYKKKHAEEPHNTVMQTLYRENLERMMALLQAKQGGKRRSVTRRAKSTRPSKSRRAR